jgi:hypothetical protein
MSYHNWNEFEEEIFFDKLKREIDKHQQEVVEDEEVIPDRELSDIAYMTKQLEESTDEEESDEDDSDWTPHECSSDEDIESEEEY